MFQWMSICSQLQVVECRRGCNIISGSGPSCPSTCLVPTTCVYQLGADVACLSCPCNSTTSCPVNPLNTTWSLDGQVQTTGVGFKRLVIRNLPSGAAGTYYQTGFVQGVGSCPYSTVSLVVTHSFSEYIGDVCRSSRDFTDLHLSRQVVAGDTLHNRAVSKLQHQAFGGTLKTWFTMQLT